MIITPPKPGSRLHRPNRPMKTLAIIALKGGTGKTTLAVNLAARACAHGHRVLLADADPQGSAVAWSKLGGGLRPAAQALNPGSLFAAQWTAQNGDFDLMVIDTPASSKGVAVEAARLADLVLIVVRPTVIDLKAISDTVELLRPLQRLALFVINQAPSQRVNREPVIVTEAIELLLHYGLRVAPIGVRTRQIYQTSFSRGATPAEEQPGGPAHLEIERLYDVVADQLWPSAHQDVVHVDFGRRTNATPQMLLNRSARPTHLRA